MTTVKIAEGVNLNIIPSDKFKSNFLSINFVTALTDTNASGAALLSKVLLRASKKYPSTALISSRLEYLYDMSVSMRSYKRGEILITSYESEFLKDDFVPKGSEKLLFEAVDMFNELVYNPLCEGGFDEGIVAQEKTDLVNSIRAIINNKNAYAKQQCTTLMCEGENYTVGELGSEQAVGAFTHKSLVDFYAQFIRNAGIEIYFVGECNNKELENALKNVFCSLERQPCQVPETFVTDKAHENVLQKCEEMDVTQGKLAMGFRTGVTLTSQNAPAFAMFCEIFGGSPVSKLFLNVREKLSLCYYCRSMADSYKGVMFILSGIENCNKDKAVDAIMKELSDMKIGEFSQGDIDSAVLSMSNAYKELSDNPSGLCSWYLSRRLLGDMAEPCDVIEKIKSVTKQQIMDAANKAVLDTVYFLKGTEA